ncbi:MAG: HD domain-containing protein [Chitinophagaceae bacterium]|nr:MAG: HD domain-containing protein [Chitinophagaceae bacterium]
MNQITKALLFATEAHGDRTCINSLTPYIGHVLDGFRTLSNITSDEVVLTALLLHDTLQYDLVSLESIRESFGNDVANLLDSFGSIDKLDKPDQWPNKGVGLIEHITLHFIEAEATRQQLLLLATIMIHNIKETQHSYFAKEWPSFPPDQPIEDDELFKDCENAVRLSKEKLASIEYYETIAQAFSKRVDEFPELDELVQRLRGEACWFLQF